MEENGCIEVEDPESLGHRPGGGTPLLYQIRTEGNLSSI